MGETFLVNIDCTKVLGDSDVSQYTMFIDSSKMSIVYELVEWIRWIFSLDTCFYITHNNSVIHELEDILLLSRLQNFELKPCGRIDCVHKMMYRTLLKNLNLFVSWNGLEVPKYFLHKLNQMDSKVIQETNKLGIQTPGPKDHNNFPDYKDKKFGNITNVNHGDTAFFLCNNNLPESSKESMPLVKTATLIGKAEAKWGANNESTTEEISFIDKNVKTNVSFSNSEGSFRYVNQISNICSGNSTLETTKKIKGSVSMSPIKSTLKAVQKSSKVSAKPNSKKHVKPFSLGEILSNMREEFEKQKIRKSSPSSSSILLKEEDLDEKMTTGENSLTTEIKSSGGKKRQRTRKRKKSKKENVEFMSQVLDNIIADHSVVDFSGGGLKPNHIRFDSDDEDMMETECGEENLTHCVSISKELNEHNGFSQSEQREQVAVITEKEGTISSVNSAGSKMQESVAGQFVAEDKLIDLDNQECDHPNQSYAGSGNMESKNFNPDLNMLLSLKEKFKNAVVIERFY